MSEEILELDDALESMKDNPPDGFMINLVYYDTTVTNANHVLHPTMEMIKEDFQLLLRKRACQVKDLQYFQVDLIWFGDFKNMGSELKRLDKILNITNEGWVKNGDIKGDIGRNVSFVMKPENNPTPEDEELF